MNYWLNYILESTLSLVVFAGLYQAVLRKGKHFAFNRAFLMMAWGLSVALPFLHLNTLAWLPSLGEQVAHLRIQPSEGITPLMSDFSEPDPKSISWVWMAYLSGVVFSLVLFLWHLLALLRYSRSGTRSVWRGYRVVESSQWSASFSFLHTIFLGRDAALSEQDRQYLLMHEETHLRLRHSWDLLLLRLVQIALWFQPWLYWYRHALVEQHEYQADEGATQMRTSESYCRLLMRTALNRAGVSMSHSFAQSFTRKRIHMLQRTRTHLSTWKKGSLVLAGVLMAMAIACQDQLAEIQEATQNSSMALSWPPAVETRLLELKKQNPNSEFIVLELTEEGTEQVKRLTDVNRIASIEIIKNAAEGTFAILEKGADTQRLADISAQDEIFTIVEQSATPKGGMAALYESIRSTLRYPAEARRAGIQGRVFVEFVVNQDGTVSHVTVIKGIGHGCDEEAARVVGLFEPWEPGRQKGKIVRQKMVLPIIFQLGESVTGSGK